MELVHIVIELTTDHVMGTMEFYLDQKSTWYYESLIECLTVSFESGKMFSSLVSDFYIRSQKNKETEDRFTIELQVLNSKVICVRPEL